MAPLTLACRLVLAGVFAYSGSAKLVARAAFRQSLVAFRLPRWLTTVVPVVELAIAVVLIVGLRRAWPAATAAVLVVVFTLAIVRSLLAGVRAPCLCFGARPSDEVSAWTIVRNGWLLALAIVGTGSASSAGGVVTALATLGTATITVAVIGKLP